MEKKMKVLLPDECISGIYEENGMSKDIVHLLEDLVKEKDAIKTVDCLINIHSSQLYHEISQTVTMLGDFGTSVTCMRAMGGEQRAESGELESGERKMENTIQI
jgi:hypothetical protein